MVALVAGGSGLIGGHLLELLSEDERFTKVLAVARRQTDVPSTKVEPVVVNFDNLDSKELPASDIAFCCLGTTIKKAGSQEAFRAVDHHAVVAFAKAAHRAGAKKFVVVTALGADTKSMVFYNRVKGEVERDLTGIGFDSLVVLRPSLLLGARKEVRTGERIAIMLAPLMNLLLVGPLATFKPISGRRVAEAMVTKATRKTEPLEIIAGSEIFAV